MYATTSSSSPYDQQSKNKARVATILIHVALLALLAINYKVEPIVLDPPPISLVFADLEPPITEGGGNVAYGEPDAGEGDNPTPISEQVGETQEPQPEAEPEPTPPPPAKSDPTPAPPAKAEDTKKYVTDNDPNGVALKKQREAREKAEREKRERDESDRRQRELADAKERSEREAKTKAEADARARAEADAKAKADAKKKFGGLFGGGGTGSGNGNTGKPGNQGDPDGDPNSTNISGGPGRGSGTGSGDGIGGNLRGRKVKSRPRPDDSSQKTGKVNVEVCVDKNGRVISANATAKGSTNFDPELSDKAENIARQYVFEPNSFDKQCGTVLVNFQFNRGN